PSASRRWTRTRTSARIPSHRTGPGFSLHEGVERGNTALDAFFMRPPCLPLFLQTEPVTFQEVDEGPALHYGVAWRCLCSKRDSAEGRPHGSCQSEPVHAAGAFRTSSRGLVECFLVVGRPLEEALAGPGRGGVGARRASGVAGCPGVVAHPAGL